MSRGRFVDVDTHRLSSASARLASFQCYWVGHGAQYLMQITPPACRLQRRNTRRRFHCDCPSPWAKTGARIFTTPREKRLVCTSAHVMDVRDRSTRIRMRPAFIPDSRCISRFQNACDPRMQSSVRRRRAGSWAQTSTSGRTPSAAFHWILGALVRGSKRICATRNNPQSI